MNKNRLRADMLFRLNKMNLQEYNQLSRAITDRFFSSEEFKTAQTIGITISRFPEVETRKLIERVWDMGKVVVVPRCIRETRMMEFHKITSFDELEIVYMDLLEPIASETTRVPQSEIELQIVPGVVYSNDGYRIGFGGGYYDRYLKTYKGNTLSLAFECQVGFNVPVESHDIGIGAILTEKSRISCRKGEQL
ncbi:5-formyltetrahydrofolate cyclo-ligase [Sporosarcina sp. CAU 1771]